MDTEVEVVEYTSKTALDRALTKEKKKKKRQSEEDKLAIRDSSVDHKGVLESRGDLETTTGDEEVVVESPSRQSRRSVMETESQVVARTNKKKKKNQDEKKDEKKVLAIKVPSEKTIVSVPESPSAVTTEIEVVEVLRKERKKIRSPEMAKVDEGVVLESQGQELLWVQEEKPPAAAATPTKKGLFGRLAARKPLMKSRQSSQPEGKVVLLSSVPTNGKREAAIKARRARQLLKEALAMDESNEERNVRLKQAFAEAAAARRLVHPNKKFDASAFSGEKEALEARRILKGDGKQKTKITVKTEEAVCKDSDTVNQKKELNNDSKPDDIKLNVDKPNVDKPIDDEMSNKNENPPQAQDKAATVFPTEKVVVENVPKAQDKAVTVSSNQKTNMTPTTTARMSQKLSQFAADPFETVRLHLEALLPDFLDEAISDEEEEEEKDVIRDEVRVIEVPVSRRKRSGRSGSSRAFKEEEKQEVSEIDRKTVMGTDQVERRRREAEQHATIARVVQQNDTMISTLGFNNTFPADSDSMTINSLNEFLDAPMSGEENSTEKARALVADKVVDEKIGTSSKSASKAKSSGFLGRKQRSDKTGQIIATVVTAGDSENEVPLSEEEQAKLAKVQDIERVTSNRLISAMHEVGGGSVSSWDGVPRHGTAPVVLQGKDKSKGALPPQRAFDGTPPLGFKKDDPTFVPAPKLKSRSLTYKSWDQLADGEALEDVASHAIEKTSASAEAPEKEDKENSQPDPAPKTKKRMGIFSRRKAKVPQERPKDLELKEAVATIPNISSGIGSNRTESVDLGPMNMSSGIYSNLTESVDLGPTSRAESADSSEGRVGITLSAITDDSCVMFPGDEDKYTAISDVEDNEEAKQRLNQSSLTIPDVLSGLMQAFSWGAGKSVQEGDIYPDACGDDMVLAQKGGHASMNEAPHPAESYEIEIER